MIIFFRTVSKIFLRSSLDRLEFRVAISKITQQIAAKGVLIKELLINPKKNYLINIWLTYLNSLYIGST